MPMLAELQVYWAGCRGSDIFLEHPAIASKRAPNLPNPIP